MRYYEQQSHISLIDEPDVGQLILNGVNNSEFRGFNTSCGTAGITGMGSHFNTFSDIISNYNSLTGIYLDHSYNNSITVGDFKFNKYGVYLFNSPNTTVAGNSITNNSYCGLFLGTSGNSLIYYNSFIANHAHFIITMYRFVDNGKRCNYCTIIAKNTCPLRITERFGIYHIISPQHNKTDTLGILSIQQIWNTNFKQDLRRSIKWTNYLDNSMDFI